MACLPAGRPAAHCSSSLALVLLSSSLAQYKVWVRSSSEMSFLYGNHILKSGIARMTEDVPQYAGLIVMSAAGTPLGFGIAAQTTDRLRDADPTMVAILHQGDIGEYLRVEEHLA